VLIVYTPALLQAMTLVKFSALSRMLKQALSLTDADYGALFLPQVALATAGDTHAGRLVRNIGFKANDRKVNAIEWR